MRTAAVSDNWRKLQKVNIPVKIEQIDLNGKNGINELNLNGNLFAICGLNGVGKTTIISAIKGLLGINLNEKDNIRLNQNIRGIISIDETEKISVENSDGNRLLDKNYIEDEQIVYLDCEQSIKIINEIVKQTNLEEFLEQYEEYSFENKELEDISYIVGKDYKKVLVKEIDDYEEDIFLPFFLVESQGITYTSLEMGVGEHLLFYYFIMMKKINKEGIVIIEEPESFISVRSQERLINYLVKKIVDTKISLIITTHSPFIIKNIPDMNLILLNRFGEYISIHNGKEKSILRELGLDINKKGIIYVEDYMAELFLKRILSSSKKSNILSDYDIKSVKGEGNITNRLKSTCTEINFDIIGIYDADMNCEKKKKQLDDLVKWKYTFLPGTKELEVEFKDCIQSNIDSFAELINKEKRDIILVLSNISGDNYHDWFINLAKNLNIEQNELFNITYNMWVESDDNNKKVDDFLLDLDNIINMET